MKKINFVKEYKHYPDMVDSGVEWLGYIPKSWDIRKLKFIYQTISGDGFPLKLQGNKEGDIPFYKVSDINFNGKYVDRSNNYVSETRCKRQGWHIIPAGSILTAKIGVALLKNHRKINSVKCLIDNNMLAFVPKKIVRTLFAYYMLEDVEFEDFQQISSVPTVDMKMLRNNKMPLPPINEQKVISDYLDIILQKVNRTIKQKHNLIKLLEEKKKTIINHAVTKGLDPNVEMIDSGIEWLGKIPKDWEIKKVKEILKISTGWTPNSNNSGFYEGSNNWVTIADMDDKYINKTKSTISDFAVNKFNMKILPKNSLLYSFKLTVGKVAFLGKPMYTNEAIVSFVPKNNEICNSFLYYPLLSYFLENAHENIYGAKMLNKSIIKNSKILLPKLSVQKEISNLLDKKISKIDELINKINKSIKLMEEYKDSLITHIVTGKVMVEDMEE